MTGPDFSQFGTPAPDFSSEGTPAPDFSQFGTPAENSSLLSTIADTGKYIGARGLGAILENARHLGAAASLEMAQPEQAAEMEALPSGDEQANRAIYGNAEISPPNVVARYGGAIAAAAGQNPFFAAIAPGYTVASSLGSEAGADINKAAGSPLPDWLSQALGGLAGGVSYGLGKKFMAPAPPPPPAEAAAEKLAATVAASEPTPQEAAQASQQAMSRYWETQEQVTQQQAIEAAQSNVTTMPVPAGKELVPAEREVALVPAGGRNVVVAEKEPVPAEGSGGGGDILVPGREVGEPSPTPPLEGEIQSPGTPVTKPTMTLEIQQAGLDAARRILMQRGINPTDLTPTRVMDIVSGIIRSATPGELSEIFPILIEHNLTPAEFADMFLATSSSAGRTLQINSTFWQNVRSRALQGDATAAQMLQSRSLDEVAAPVWKSVIQAGSGILKLLMTAQWAVAARNMLDAMLKAGGKDISRLMTAAGQMIWQPSAEIDLQAVNLGSDLSRMISPAAAMQARQQTLALNQAFPQLTSQLGTTFAAGAIRNVQNALGNGWLAKVITTPLKILSAPHTLQEAVVRQAGFTASLERRLNAVGSSIDQVLQTGQVPNGFTAMLQHSINDGLDLAWASAIPRNTALGQSYGFILKGFSNIPGLGTLAEPFARMAFNYVQGIVDWNFGLLKFMLSPREWAKVQNGDFSLLAKGALGAGMVALGYDLARGNLEPLGLHPGPRWDQIAVGDPNAQGQRKSISLLPFATLAPGMYLGSLARRLQTGDVQAATLAPLEIAKAIEARLPGVEEFNSTVGRAAEYLAGIRPTEDTEQLSEKAMGGLISATLNPLHTLWDMLSQYDPRLLVHRETMGFGPAGHAQVLLNPTSMPERLSPTQTAPVTTPTFNIGGIPISGGVLHQLTGARYEEAPSAMQAELERLGFPSQFYSPHTGNPRQDQLVDMILGPAMEHLGQALISNPAYSNASENQKAATMQILLHGIPGDRRAIGLIPAAQQAASMISPDMYVALRAQKLPPPLQRFLEQTTQGTFSAAVSQARSQGQKELEAQGR